MFWELIKKLFELLLGDTSVSPPSGSSISKVGLDLIKKWEGLRTTAYLPTPDDVWTIGYGHTKTARPGMTITATQAEELLRQDVEWVEEALAKHVKVPLNQNQYDALASFTYNLGETNLSKSTLLRLLNSGDYLGAADQFSRWVKQGTKTLTGLVNRRAEERALFLK